MSHKQYTIDLNQPIMPEDELGAKTASVLILNEFVKEGEEFVLVSNPERMIYMIQRDEAQKDLGDDLDAVNHYAETPEQLRHYGARLLIKAAVYKKRCYGSHKNMMRQKDKSPLVKMILVAENFAEKHVSGEERDGIHAVFNAAWAKQFSPKV